MATIYFDASAFHAQFPGQFTEPLYTDVYIEAFWNAATCYVSNDSAGPLSVECRRRVLNFVTAHLITLTDSSMAGNQPGYVVSASIDKISISVVAPPNKTAFQFFMFQTPYGVQAYAILSTSLAGGVYAGGRNELGMFRRSNGDFVPGNGGEAAVVPPVCPSLVVAPLAPYTQDFGVIAPASNVTQAVSILAPCLVFSAEFSSPGNAITLSLWTGSAIDTNDRFNLYFWSGDDRVAGNPATSIALGVNPTGAAIGDGFILSGLIASAAPNDPNLVVITGVDQANSQVLNLDIAAA